jgi:hypothetical protein
MAATVARVLRKFCSLHAESAGASQDACILQQYAGVMKLAKMDRRIGDVRRSCGCLNLSPGLLFVLCTQFHKYSYECSGTGINSDGHGWNNRPAFACVHPCSCVKEYVTVFTNCHTKLRRGAQEGPIQKRRGCYRLTALFMRLTCPLPNRFTSHPSSKLRRILASSRIPKQSMMAAGLPIIFTTSSGTRFR